jgi:hypothetical protein
VGEDVVAIGLTWFATTHPYIAASIAAILVVLTILAIRWVIRAIVRLFRGARHRWDEFVEAA